MEQLIILDVMLAFSIEIKVLAVLLDQKLKYNANFIPLFQKDVKAVIDSKILRNFYFEIV